MFLPTLKRVTTDYISCCNCLFGRATSASDCKNDLCIVSAMALSDSVFTCGEYMMRSITGTWQLVHTECIA